MIDRSTWNKGKNQRQMDCKVAEGNMTARKAAASYHIPKSTLHYHVKGKVQFGTGISAQRYLTDEVAAARRLCQGGVCQALVK